MTTGNIKITGSDKSASLNFSLDMDLSVSNAQKVMVYVIDLKAKELANTETIRADEPL